jgi:hypothetical protein
LFAFGRFHWNAYRRGGQRADDAGGDRVDY